MQVKYAGKALRALKASQFVQERGPTIAGLATIPFLPLVDHPIEHAVEGVFDKAWPIEGHGLPDARSMQAQRNKETIGTAKTLMKNARGSSGKKKAL